jgi:hypothetical protein
MWWGHLVCQVCPIHYGNGQYGVGAHNSWGADYGENGYFELTEAKADSETLCYAPLTSTFLVTLPNKLAHFS